MSRQQTIGQPSSTTSCSVLFMSSRPGFLVAALFMIAMKNSRDAQANKYPWYFQNRFAYTIRQIWWQISVPSSNLAHQYSHTLQPCSFTPQVWWKQKNESDSGPQWTQDFQLLTTEVFCAGVLPRCRFRRPPCVSPPCEGCGKQGLCVGCVLKHMKDEACCFNRAELVKCRGTTSYKQT